MSKSRENYPAAGFQADRKGGIHMHVSGKFLLTLLMLFLVTGSGYAGDIDIITVDGAITPVTARYIQDAVSRAEDKGAECLIIRLDTPGGLLQATMAIDKRLLSAAVPVVVYIYPGGGRAASAGVFISYAAHITAMAPSTNIGSAHPVNMGGQDTSRVMLEKITNDAVAHIRGLAQKRNRNAEWAEQAIRESVNITETEALALNVIDLIAENMTDLVDKLDGLTVSVNGREVTLNTADAELYYRDMGLNYRILDHIANPNIAYLLMMAGIFGIFFELRSPGSIFPGALGAISLILAFFAFQVLPINAAGILLILLAVVLFILEVHIVSYGLLTIGGLISMVLGSMMLYRSPELQVALSVLIPVVVGFALFFILAVYLAARAQIRKSISGKEGIVGETGTALQNLDPEGQVSVHGEIWRAVADEKIKKGTKVRVVAVTGMQLTVETVTESNR
ncbi:nodulation protein NfeD [bacterium]|nr:nodulation protein NfeD [bacterium]